MEQPNMIPKHRDFIVKGTEHYSGVVDEGDLVYFEPEPANTFDSNAIKVLNKLGNMVGYVPRDVAIELQKFRHGKYPYYCAQVKEMWEGDSDELPIILAHFANQPDELPYSPQRWIEPNSKRKEATKYPIWLNRIMFLLPVFFSICGSVIAVRLTDNLLIGIIVLVLMMYIGINLYIRRVDVR